MLSLHSHRSTEEPAKKTAGDVAPSSPPSLDEIKKTKPVALSATLRNIPGISVNPWVHKIEPGVWIKTGVNVKDEIACLTLVCRNTTIPTSPLLHSSPHRPPRYFCMGDVPGVTLESRLEHMTVPELDAVASQLKSYIAQMRKFKAPGLGSITGGPYSCGFFFEYPPKSQFRNVREFNQHFRDVFTTLSFGQVEWGENIMSPFPVHAAVFLTHGDIAPQNIILQDSKVFLLDWGLAGWYPEYWEYCRMRQWQSGAETRTATNWEHIVHSVFPRRDVEFQAYCGLGNSLIGAGVLV